MKLIFIFFLFSIILAASPSSKLRLGKNYFKFGDYKKAIKIVKKLPMSLDKDSDRVEAYKLLGSSYYFEKKYEDSKKAFINMLGISSKATLDSLLYPPPLIEFFNRINKEFQKKNRELEKLNEKNREVKTKIIYKEIRWKYVEERKIIIEKNPYFSQFIPFGYSQYRNGDTSKAYILATAESILITTNILSYWLTRNLADENGYYDKTKETAKVYLNIQRVSLLALIGFMIYGGIDGVVNYKPIFKKEIKIFKKKPIKLSFADSSDSMITLSYKF